MCTSDDGYNPEFYSRVWKIARISHKCYECRRVIQPKEKYCRVSGKWDYEILVFKTCTHCMKAGEWLDKECGGWPHGGLEDELLTHVEKCGHGFLEPLYIGVRTGWSD